MRAEKFKGRKEETFTRREEEKDEEKLPREPTTTTTRDPEAWPGLAFMAGERARERAGLIYLARSGLFFFGPQESRFNRRVCL